MGPDGCLESPRRIGLEGGALDSPLANGAGILKDWA